MDKMPHNIPQISNSYNYLLTDWLRGATIRNHEQPIMDLQNSDTILYPYPLPVMIQTP